MKKERQRERRRKKCETETGRMRRGRNKVRERSRQTDKTVWRLFDDKKFEEKEKDKQGGEKKYYSE